ncbi:MAG: amidohydrolase [Alphaproteobacteria bacterium]|nr:amidohydrolase [Alphaproteobacteria bacterium]
MPVINRIAAFHEDMIGWRQEIHRHPETAFEEHRTAELVARQLEAFGISVDRGLAGTGVVGTLRAGSSDRAIALRADLDALHIQEKNEFAHRSTVAGKMHACGHDGHTTMLLGAARYLAETRKFDGVVHFVFQPAEENEGGGRVMVEQGLFAKFPCEAVYGMHNWPGRPTGDFAIKAGPMMASYDVFEIVVEGRGSHGAMPHQSIDPVVVAAQIVVALQTIVSRNVKPADAAVVSVTQIHGGDTWNVIPDEVVLRGTTRCFSREIRDQMQRRIDEIAGQVAAAFGARATTRYERRYPALVNDPDAVRRAVGVATEITGDAARVETDCELVMGSEDFAFMLEAKPGAYIMIGNGGGEGGRMLHNARYDFNDAILPIGASYWARLVETSLPAAK